MFRMDNISAVKRNSWTGLKKSQEWGSVCVKMAAGAANVVMSSSPSLLL